MSRLIFLASFLIISTYITGQSQTIDTLINVGNHHLHFKILQGKGMPILFEAGNGDDGQVWEDLLTPLADSIGTTLITYDRAGLGQSGIDTSNMSFQEEIEDLEYALHKLGYSKEIFIVSHSFGGFYSTLYSTRNKKKVKGAVFIDVALPCFFTKEWSKNYIRDISDEDWEMIRTYKLGLYFVLKNLPSISVLMNDKHIPESIPVTLIAAEKILPMVKENEVEKWKACLESFGSLPNHKYILAEETGHKVWKDNLLLVLKEIISLYKQVNH